MSGEALGPQPCLRGCLRPDLLELKHLPWSRFGKFTHGAFTLFSDVDMVDGVVLDGEFTLGGKPNGLVVGAGAFATFFGLSSESELFALCEARDGSP